MPVQINLVMREIGGLRPDWSVRVDVPEVPRVGDLISVHRADCLTDHSDDGIVKKVWWRIDDFGRRAIVSDQTDIAGELREVVVECAPAIGPWSADHHHDALDAAAASGVAVERFEIERLSVREDFVIQARRSTGLPR
jgi:hypothetical protein